MLNRELQNRVLKRNNKVKTIDPDSIIVLLNGLKDLIDTNIEVAKDMKAKDKVGISPNVHKLIDFAADLLESSILVCSLSGLDAEPILNTIMYIRDGSSTLDANNFMDAALQMFAGTKEVLADDNSD